MNHLDSDANPIGKRGDAMADSPSATALVSVGMPVYNGERFVAEAIESILGQTHSHLELIISDNASNDGTEEICRRYQRLDPRVRYYRSDVNRGAAWNFNRVFHLARGKYFKWASSDDVCHPEYIASCLPVLEANPDVVLCYGRTRIIDAEGRPLGDYEDQLDLQDDSPVTRFYRYLSNVRMCNPVFGLIRPQALARTRLLGAFVGSDNCLLGHLALLGKFVELPRVMFFRRWHEAASSYDKSLKAQMAFFDPRWRGKVATPALRRWAEFVRIASDSSLSATDRARVYIRLLQILAWWRDVYGPELRQALVDLARA
jgi:glycosyltransferase involved in cell wall biosynthesis